MQDIWRRLEAYLHGHLPEAYADLLGPADESDIEQVEHVLGMRLPADFRASLALHDGQRGKSLGIIGNWQLLPLQDCLREWRLWRELQQMRTFDGWATATDRGIRNGWWNPAWVPITVDKHGNHHCIDLDPDTHGKTGQIIVVRNDTPRREYVAESFGAWLTHITRHLEASNYRLLYNDHGMHFGNDGFLQQVTSLDDEKAEVGLPLPAAVHSDPDN